MTEPNELAAGEPGFDSGAASGSGSGVVDWEAESASVSGSGERGEGSGERGEGGGEPGGREDSPTAVLPPLWSREHDADS